MKIINYRIYNDMEIEFQDEHKYITNTTYCNFSRGTIKNPYDVSVHGKGYMGVGRYVAKINDKLTVQYACWKNLLERCYSEIQKDKHPAYYGITTVCNEWLNFQTFAQWYDDNFYYIENERTHLDKDILVKDNKVYSPETCIFVPQRINMIFMKKERKIDADLPTGIHRCVTGFSTFYNTKNLGIYKTLDESLYYYNIEKQLHINRVAEEYKLIIPPKLYNALLNWNCKLVA